MREPIWHSDIDALAFVPEGHVGRCMVHRLAFRALLGSVDPSAEHCVEFYRRHVGGFATAAAAKIRAREIAPDANFHLNSRDVRRALSRQRVSESS